MPWGSCCCWSSGSPLRPWETQGLAPPAKALSSAPAPPHLPSLLCFSSDGLAPGWKELSEGERAAAALPRVLDPSRFPNSCSRAGRGWGDGDGTVPAKAASAPGSALITVVFPRQRSSNALSAGQTPVPRNSALDHAPASSRHPVAASSPRFLALLPQSDSQGEVSPSTFVHHPVSTSHSSWLSPQEVRG